MTKYYNIGISCIGTGVGQAVINSCRLSRLPIKTIGFGNNPFAYGAYDCDTYDYTSSIYNHKYIDSIINKCKKFNIDLLIPGCDDEALIFAENNTRFEKEGIKTLCASKNFIALCRNKDRLGEYMNKIANIFVRSYNKNSILQEVINGNILFPFIAKPIGGSSSRGVEIIRTVEDLNNITSDHIIQELAIPKVNDPNYKIYKQQIKYMNPQVSEISIQLVIDPHGKLIGKMASYNKLKNGIPIEIIPFENDYVWRMIDKIMPAMIKIGLKGPLNIQGRLTNTGLKLFEMNPRFTGITGLRALMGFNEVEACIKRWLGIKDGKNSLKINFNRFGIRQTADKVLPIERNDKIYKLYTKLNNGEVKKKKTLLITGACGYLGQNFIEKAAKDKRYKIWAFSMDKEKAINLFGNIVDECFNKIDLETGRLAIGNVDVLLHFGFANMKYNNLQIADSLAFTSELFTRATNNHVPAIVNISSQSVYGQEREPIWDEKTPVAPQTVYAQAKYATELMLKSAREINNQILATSLRLAGITGGQKGLNTNELVAKFVKQALIGDTITIVGGNQQLERLDIRDAVSAILSLIEVSPQKWAPIYNLGSGNIYNILELAKIAVRIASPYSNKKKSEIIIVPKEMHMKFGMNSFKFYHEINWKPKYDIYKTIISLVNYFLNSRKGNFQKPTDS